MKKISKKLACAFLLLMGALIYSSDTSTIIEGMDFDKLIAQYKAHESSYAKAGKLMVAAEAAVVIGTIEGGFASTAASVVGLIPVAVFGSSILKSSNSIEITYDIGRIIVSSFAAAGLIFGFVNGAAIPFDILKNSDATDRDNRIHTDYKSEFCKQPHYKIKLKTDEEQIGEAIVWGTLGLPGCTALLGVGASALAPQTDVKIITAGSAAVCAATYGALVASLEYAKRNK